MKTRMNEKVPRGTMRTETSRDRSDDMRGSKTALKGKSMKDTGVRHSLKGGSVPRNMGHGS